MSERQISKDGQKKEEKVRSISGVVLTPPGSAIAPVYKRVYVKEKDKAVVQKVDEMNIHEFIQASKSTTDLAVLQKRFIELGEIPAVDPTLQYVDNTVMPGDIHELYRMVNDVAGNFSKLPESVQALFGNKDAYLEAVLNGTYESTLVKAFNEAKQEKNEEKKEGNE